MATLNIKEIGQTISDTLTAQKNNVNEFASEKKEQVESTYEEKKDEAQSLYNDMANMLEKRLNETQRQIMSEVDTRIEQAQEGLSQAQDTLNHQAEIVDETVKERRWTAVFLSFMFGLLIGLFIQPPTSS